MKVRPIVRVAAFLGCLWVPACEGGTIAIKEMWQGFGGWVATAPGGYQAYTAGGAAWMDYAHGAAVAYLPITQVTDLGGGQEEIQTVGTVISFAYFTPGAPPYSFVELGDLRINTLTATVYATLRTSASGFIGADIPILSISSQVVNPDGGDLTFYGHPLLARQELVDAWAPTFPTTQMQVGEMVFLQQVPEPSTLASFAVGGLSLLLAYRRKHGKTV